MSVVSKDLACRWIGRHTGYVIRREGLPQVGDKQVVPAGVYQDALK